MYTFTGVCLRNLTLRNVEIQTSPRQLACYMKHKQLPPTTADVVKENLKRSKVGAEEFGHKYALATYGLAIAKMVNRIQYEETLQFDNIFIMSGTFLVEMAFFIHLITIEGFGEPHILSGKLCRCNGFHQ